MKHVMGIGHVMKDLVVVELDHVVVVILGLIFVDVQLSVNKVMVETPHFL